MEITANAIQTVNANQDVLFTDTAVPGSYCIMHRAGSGLVTLRGLTTGQCRARFRATFSANVATPTGGGSVAVPVVSLALALSGEPVPTSSMIVTPTGANNYFNVSSSIFVDVPAGCGVTLSVMNTSEGPIEVQNANLIVERVA